MLNIFIEDSGPPKHPNNVKSISNTTGSHLVSCRVIYRSGESGIVVYILMKRRQNLFFF